MLMVTLLCCLSWCCWTWSKDIVGLGPVNSSVFTNYSTLWSVDPLCRWSIAYGSTRMLLWCIWHVVFLAKRRYLWKYPGHLDPRYMLIRVKMLNASKCLHSQLLTFCQKTYLVAFRHAFFVMPSDMIGLFIFTSLMLFCRRCLKDFPDCMRK